MCITENYLSNEVSKELKVTYGAIGESQSTYNRYKYVS
jgi:hypothetical protein